MKINEYIEITNEDNMLLMARYPDNYFDLAVVDPPYGIDVAKWDLIDMKPNNEYFAELFRVSKNQIIWGANYFDLPHNEGWICWDKTYRLGNMKRKGSEFELAWSSLDDKGVFLRFSSCGNFRGFENPKANYEMKKSFHPTSKPIEVYEWIFKNYTKGNDKIIDTHLGSGTIAIALDKVNKIEKMNLTLVGCELDKKYFKNSINQIIKQTNWQSLF